MKIETFAISDKPEIERAFISDQNEEGLSVVIGGECHLCDEWPTAVIELTDPRDSDQEFLICLTCMQRLLNDEWAEYQKMEEAN